MKSPKPRPPTEAELDAAMKARVEALMNVIQPAAEALAMLCREHDINFVAAFDVGSTTLAGLVGSSAVTTPKFDAVAQLVQMLGRSDADVAVMRGKVDAQGNISVAGPPVARPNAPAPKGKKGDLN